VEVMASSAIRVRMSKVFIMSPGAWWPAAFGAAVVSI
jgi:hypothetical protein